MNCVSSARNIENFDQFRVLLLIKKAISTSANRFFMLLMVAPRGFEPLFQP